MPVQRTRISRRQPLPTISEAHGAISAFPMPEIKGAPQEVAPFIIGPHLPSLIERDDIRESRERRMGRKTKEEREAKRKAKKEQRRAERKAEKKRAKEIEAAKDETSTTSDIISTKSPKHQGSDESMLSPRSRSKKRPSASPTVSLDEAIKKRELMAAIMDTSKLPFLPLSDDSEANTTHVDKPSRIGGLVHHSEMEKAEALVAVDEGAEENQIRSKSTLQKLETITSKKAESSLPFGELHANASARPRAVDVLSNSSLSLVYDNDDNKVQSSYRKPVLQMDALESNHVTINSELEDMKSQLIAAGVSKKPSMSKLYNEEGQESPSPSPASSGSINRQADCNPSPTETDDDDVERSPVPIEVGRLSLCSDKDPVEEDEIAAEPMVIESIQKPSDPEPAMFATKGPYARRGSFSGSVDETTLEISLSSSDNDFEEPAQELVFEEEINTDAYDTMDPNMERNLRRISIRKPSTAGPRPTSEGTSDDEHVSLQEATSFAPDPSTRGDRPMLVRRESKSDLRKFRNGPQVLATSLFGIVRLSDQQTLESSFIGDAEEILSDDDIILHDGLSIEDEHLQKDGIGECMDGRYDTRVTEERSSSDEDSCELIVEEEKDTQQSWITLIIALLVVGVSTAIYFAVANTTQDAVSGANPIITSQPGQMKYDPPTAEECAIIASGRTLNCEEDLFRHDLDLLIDVELADGFSLAGPNGLLQDLQARMDKYLVPHLAGCDDVPRDRLLRGLSQTQTLRQLANVRYVIANGDAVVKLDSTRSCDAGTSANCYAVIMSLHLKLKGEENSFPVTKVVHQSLDADNALSQTLHLSSPFERAIVRDIVQADAFTMFPTDSPSSAPTIAAPTGSQSSLPTKI